MKSTSLLSISFTLRCFSIKPVQNLGKLHKYGYSRIKKLYKYGYFGVEKLHKYGYFKMEKPNRFKYLVNLVINEV